MKTYLIANTPLETTRIAYGCMGIGGGWAKGALAERTRGKPLPQSTLPWTRESASSTTPTSMAGDAARRLLGDLAGAPRSSKHHRPADEMRHQVRG